MEKGHVKHVYAYHCEVLFTGELEANPITGVLTV